MSKIIRGAKGLMELLDNPVIDPAEVNRKYSNSTAKVLEPFYRPNIANDVRTFDQPPFRLSQLEGRGVMFPESDVTAAGYDLVGIGNKPLARPVTMETGVDHIFYAPDNALWKNDASVANKYLKRAKARQAEVQKLGKETGGQDVFLLPYEGGPQSSDWWTGIGRTMINYNLENAPAKSVSLMDEFIKSKIPEWPGSDSPDAEKIWNATGGGTRMEITQALDQMRLEGGLTEGQARVATSRQDRLNIPHGSLQNVGVMDIERGFTPNLSPDYNASTHGEGVGILKQPVTAYDFLLDRTTKSGKPLVPRSLQWQDTSKVVTEQDLKRMQDKGIDINSPAAVGLLSGAGALAALAPQEAEAGAAGLLNKIRAYHGSPHDFDRFSTESIGTGEGAQQYGHGLYFAEREPTALSYRDALTPRDYEFENYLAMQNEMAENSGNYTRMEFLQQAMNHDTPQDFRNIASDSDYDDDYREMAADFADEMEAFRNESGEPVNFGRMYEVDIDARPEELLDFDAPLSEQSEQVQNAFSFKPAPMPNFTADDVKKTLSDNPAYRYAVEGFPAAETVEKALSQANKPVLQNTGPLGAEAYNKLARELADETSDLTGAKSASEALRQSGVKGIKYADAQTRFSPKGRTSNYVIFDDATVDIARKYGVSMPVAAGLLSGGLGTEQAQAAEYSAAPVVQEQSFGDMVNEYAQINQRAQAAEAQKFDTLMREDARLRDMGSAAFGQVSPELAAYRRSQMLPTIGEIGMGALEGAVDTVDFVSQLPTAISTMTMPKRTPLRDRLGGLLDYSFVDERDQRARDQARLIGGLLSPI
jgi:hypothetical protein